MEIVMDILQNSKDYLNQSIELADIADEFGNHDEDKSDVKAKIKWKLAFICIVQSMELLCKKSLSDVNFKLLYKDIDTKSIDFKLTINLSTAILRLIDFTNISFSDEEIRLIDKAVRMRNDFIHFDVKLHTEEIKNVYCRLLKLYTKIYTEFVEETFYLNIYNSRGYGNFIHFADFLVPYRGSEIRKDQLQEEIEAVKENQKHHVYIKDGKSYGRVVYGTEMQLFPELFSEDKDETVYQYTHCDDCLAMKGEYHGEQCDLEICPRCKRQRLTCGCFEKYHY